MYRLLLGVFCGAFVGCGSNATAPNEPRSGSEGGAPAQPQRPTWSVEECEAQGVVVGDPGDGRTHRADYRCPSGDPPLAFVNLGIEGSVCCPE